MDGDGKPDLAVATNARETGMVSVFRNNMSGNGNFDMNSFDPRVDFTTGAYSNPRSLAIGDLDVDGRPDLAVVNSNLSTLSVFRNTSSIGRIDMALKVDFTTGAYSSLYSFSSSVAIGDLNGDRRPDLAVQNQGLNMVSVLFSNTTSSVGIDMNSFAPKVDFTTGINSSPISVAIGDLTGDGTPDLAVANQSSNTVSVFRNTSMSGSIGTGSFAPKVDFATGSQPYLLAIGDLDGDGKPDLATANSSSNTVSVLRNASNNADLSALTLSVGSLNPAFATANIAYTKTVSNATNSVKVTPTLEDANASVTVNGIPVVSAASGNFTLYEGSNTITIVVTAQNATTKTYTITIIRLILPTFDAIAPICSGATIAALPTTSNNDIQGTWSPVLNNTLTTTYTFTPNAGQNASSTTILITVTDNPVATASSSSSVCSGNSILLTGGGVGTYAWSGPDSFSSTAKSPTITNATASKSGTYTLTVTNANGCTSTATTSVTVNPNPVATASSSTPTICAGNTLSLTGGGVGTYAWSGPNAFSSTNQSPMITSATTFMSGTYTLTVTNANGCASTATTSVTVNANPVATASSSSSVCSGNTISLTGGGVGTYAWSGPNSFSSTAQSPTITNATASTSGKYTLSVTNESGCTSTATTSVTVNPIVVIPTPQANTQIYFGASVTLTATGCSNSNDSFKWYQSSDNTLVTMPVSPPVTTNYYAKCETTFNSVTCPSSKSNDATLRVVNRIFVDISKIIAPIQNGNSWATAYGNLQTALAAATANVEIWVAKGIYKPTITTTRTIYFEIPTDVKVYGGFAGTENTLNDRNFTTNVSILSGDIGIPNLSTDNSYHVVVLSGSSNTTLLDGFTITRGSANFNPKINSYSAVNNPNSPAQSGASIETGGGILVLNAGKPIIAHCSFVANNAIFGGGICCVDGSTPTINACIISNNESTFGSAMYAQNASHFTMNNVLITANKGLGCVYNNLSNPTLTNCTIASNGGYNGAILNSQSQPSVKNSIIWGNVGPFSDTQSIITYSVVQGGYLGVGNMNTDPQLVNPAAFGPAPNTTGDYHLKGTSLAIDRGDNGSVSLTNKDLDGNTRRFSGGRVDMGAYEFQGTGTSTLIISVVTGLWEANSTWDLGRVPQLGDYVIIDNNHIVILSTTGIAKSLEYRGNGMLKSNAVTSKLKLGF